MDKVNELINSFPGSANHVAVVKTMMPIWLGRGLGIDYDQDAQIKSELLYYNEEFLNEEAEAR